ncbi:MAG: hypothetical protein ACD_45C00742G0008 [uncultured bacterium]|nr:MAG: hypothetical protein ACD_45C00742G0008 [uncultured bacterium]
MNIEYMMSTTELRVQEAKPQLKQPAMYQVVMHNDDFTPMEFVVAVLEAFFNMERAIAARLMYEVHTTGKAVCGIFSKDVAETKVDQVMDYARMHDHPLLCNTEVT